MMGRMLTGTIALAMIVRDEASTIERCLQSVRGLIDSYVIVDTGSTDGTQRLISQSGIDGELHQRPWVNFGHNRTELMDLAYGKADWLLLLDADHTVTHEYAELGNDTDSYMLRHDSEPEYWIKRLVSGHKHWRYVGATHEFITTDEPERSAKRLDSIVVHHHGDGGHRPEKFQRDLDLLQAEHDRDPENPRTTFYLANTLRDLGRHEEAIDIYLRRVNMNGWEEERFYAMYEAGRLAGNLDMLLTAWSIRPSRAEPLYEIAWRLRKRRLWPAAYLAAHEGAQLPIPDDTLFVHRWVYEWGCEFELSIAAWWCDRRDQARKATERLLACPTLPGNYRQQVISNMEYL